MYLTPTDKHWAIDVEADSLAPTVIHCVCVRNVKTQEEKTLISYEDIKKFFEEKLAEGCVFIGHNLLTYDVPALNRLVGTRIPSNRVVDTFVLSMLYSPSLAGGHSLDAWGERLGLPKGQWTDFSQLSEGMIEYCIQDVRINALLYLRLTLRMNQVGFTERGCEIEHKAWRIIDKQKKNGFYFDERRAHELFATLRGEEAALREAIYHQFPPEEQLIATYQKAFKKDGTPTKTYENHLEQFKRIEVNPDGTYRAYADVEFNLGSPQQRVEKLLELGWEPEEFTKPSKTHPNGQPQPTKKGDLSPSLAKFAEEAGIPEVKLIAEWIAINSRANAISNWLDLYNKETGCIHGNLWLANTLRYRHDKPNTANIPAVRLGRNDGIEAPLFGKKGYYTYEARDLWCTRNRVNRNLVGVDAKGIQLRILAHYLNNPAFTKAILAEDPHTANQELIGLPSRALTKTITYATLMGAGDKKIANEAKISLKEAKAAKKKFLLTIGGFDVLVKRLKRELERTGRITLCDGSRIMVSSDHMVIPYLLQGDESRIMKQAAIYVDEEVRRHGLDVLKVGDIHDEWQSDVSIRDTERYIEICRDAFKRAGESFQYNVPIDCDAKVGKTWAETH